MNQKLNLKTLIGHIELGIRKKLKMLDPDSGNIIPPILEI